MDRRGKEKVLALHAHAPSPRCPASIAYEGWQCSVNGVKISSNPGKVVRRAVFGTKLCTHLTGKHWITQVAFHTTEGKISVQWKQLQAEHYRSIDLRQSPGKWAAGLITYLL
jgi:hypothetical protein